MVSARTRADPWSQRPSSRNHPPLCSENSSNFEAKPSSPHRSGNNGFQRALFRTWKFSVRPTSCTTTTRNFKLGWRLKWERYFRRHDTAIERHLRRRFEAELNRYSPVERMQFFFFFFLFREKLLIARKCGDVHCASGPFI